jgi:hypothetical protein
MANSIYSQDFRLLLPETVWLETEHFVIARKITSLNTANVNDSWQVYLNTLALLGFETWLRERLSDKVISLDTDSIVNAGYLKVGKFKFCAIATEHLLDEIAHIPQEVIENPELAAHFYLLLEVLEEEEVIIRGFVTYNQLIEIKSNLELLISEGCYIIPLSFFNTEPNHLLVYQHYLEASEFGLPIVNNLESEVTQIKAQISENVSQVLSKTTTKLSQWLKGIANEGWQTIDSFSNLKFNVAVRNIKIDTSTKRAKIIDLGIDLGNQKLALLLNIFPQISSDSQKNDRNYKIGVLAQLYPMNGKQFLPHNIKLVLLSKSGKIIQEVTSRIQDNYIQLKLFRGEPGKKFSIIISLGNISVEETFEL